jgi:hypothetical protein
MTEKKIEFTSVPEEYKTLNGRGKSNVKAK